MVITDSVVKFAAIAVLLAHIVVLLGLRRRIAMVAGLNLVVSFMVVTYWATNLPDLIGSVPLVWAFAAFEIAVLATSLLATFVASVPPAVIWAEFAAHLLLTSGALYFMLTFKLTRLI
jgi:hypothetical protein